MIILVEGPDGAGKSTLAEKLSSAFGMPIHHFTEPVPGYDPLQECLEFIQEHDNYIIDRAWPSTQVYAPIKRNAVELPHGRALEIERTYRDKLIIIYCTGNPRELWDNCQKRGEDYVTSYEEHLQICKAYDDLMYNKAHAVPIFTWSIGGELCMYLPTS